MKTINTIPNTATRLHNIDITINGAHIYIHLHESTASYYAEMTGWYSGKNLFSARKSEGLDSFIKEVSAYAFEQGLGNMLRDNQLFNRK